MDAHCETSSQPGIVSEAFTKNRLVFGNQFDFSITGSERAGSDSLGRDAASPVSVVFVVVVACGRQPQAPTD
jgi:hypothetical protein